MPRAVALLAALGLAACTCTEKDSSADPRGGLRVPLPDGWKAVAVEGGLHVGPTGRVVLQLESTTREQPTLDALVRTLEREKVVIIHKESSNSFVGVRYSFGEHAEGFVGVRQVGARTVWCATTREATAEAVRASLPVCRDVSFLDR